MFKSRSRRVWAILVVATLALLACAAIWLRTPVQFAADALCVPTSHIVDRNGRTLGALADPRLGYCEPLPLDAFPDHLIEAVIATEDARYFEHYGVDPVGLVRAAWLDLRAGCIVAGGSTLTQQVARMLVLGRGACFDRSPVRKLREMAIALRIEAQLDKDDILALHLNQAYWGDLAYGAGAASWAVFDKPAEQLDLAECALLAGMLQGPELYDPFENPEGAKARQRIVLGLMVKQGYITEAQADAAATESLAFRSRRDAAVAHHACVLIEEQIKDVLGDQTLAQGGLIIETTLDADLQACALEQTRLHLATLNRHGVAESGTTVADNAAVLALNATTGAILAMVGSPNHQDARIDGAVNACLTPRQPGSALKPFTYALAFQQGAGPATVVADVRTAYVTREGEPYVPVNYDYEYHGPVSLRQALACSYNGVAVQMLADVGVDAWIDAMGELGFTTLDDADRHGLALTLGSCEVSLIELTAAYGCLANGGATVEPYLIERIVSNAGDVLYEHESPQPRQLLDPRVAYLVTDILSDDAARAPAFGEGSVLDEPFPAAVKTGTTTDWRDNWTVGYTPATVVGVWVGNADNRAMRNISGVDGAAPIWHAVLARVQSVEGGGAFERPPGLVEVEVCPDSGLLLGDACSDERRELFLAEGVPTSTCDVHTFVHVDAWTGDLADAETDAAHIERLPARFWSSELLPWASEQGLVTNTDKMAMAAQSADEPSRLASQGLADDRPRILRPDQGATYAVAAGIPATHQCIPVVMAGDPTRGAVRLVVDGTPITDWRVPSCEALWMLAAGTHTLVVEQLNEHGGRLFSEPVIVRVAAECELAQTKEMTDERTGS